MGFTSFFKSIGHDISKAATSVGHSVESAAKSVEHAGQSVIKKGEDAVGTVYKDAKSVVSGIGNEAKSIVDTAETAAKSIVPAIGKDIGGLAKIPKYIFIIGIGLVAFMILRPKETVQLVQSGAQIAGKAALL